MYNVTVTTKLPAPVNVLAMIRAANPSVPANATIKSVTITSAVRAITGATETITESSIHVTSDGDALGVEHTLSIPLGQWSVVTLVGVLNYQTGVFHFGTPEVVGLTFNVALN